MSTFTAVILCHDDPAGLERAAHMVARQSRQADEVLIYASDLDIVATTVLGIPIIPTPNENDWGQGKVDRSLHAARSEWVGWLNSDDTWDPWYIEVMMSYTEGRDLVLTATEQIHDPAPVVSYCTRGAYIVRTALARSFPYGRGYDADGILAQNVANRTGRWISVYGPFHQNV